MAGFSCVTFRGICHGLGSDYAPTELTSARSIVMNGVGKSYRFMRIDPESEGVTCIQLFGNTPEDFTEAMKIICEDELLSRVDIFDINMGCPVQKVVKTGAGSGLLKTPELAGKIVRESRKTAEELGKVLTVKTRIGFAENSKNGPEFAKILADNGAQSICVHGRTAAQMYAGEADWEQIRLMCESVSSYDVYFFANGDVKDGPSARRILDVTGADGVMIGRAACGNPWLFREVKEHLLCQNADNTIKNIRTALSKITSVCHGLSPIKIILQSNYTITKENKDYDIGTRTLSLLSFSITHGAKVPVSQSEISMEATSKSDASLPLLRTSVS